MQPKANEPILCQLKCHSRKLLTISQVSHEVKYLTKNENVIVVSLHS